MIRLCSQACHVACWCGEKGRPESASTRPEAATPAARRLPRLSASTARGAQLAHRPGATMDHPPQQPIRRLHVRLHARLQRQRAQQRHRLREHAVPAVEQHGALASPGLQLGRVRAPGHAGARPHRGGPGRARPPAPPRPCRRPRALPEHRRCRCALAWTGEAARCSMRRGAARRACPRASQPPPCAPACAPSSAPSPEAAPIQGRPGGNLPPPRNRSLAASIAATRHLHLTSRHRARRPQSSSSLLEPRPAAA